MIRKLISLALLLAFGLLGYNYFFGSAEEKAQSKQVFSKAKDLTIDLANVLKSEHSKMKNGKYDGALEKLGETYKSLRTRLSKLDGKIVDELSELENRKILLEQESQKLQNNNQNYSEEELEQLRSKLQDDIDILYKDTESLVREIKK